VKFIWEIWVKTNLVLTNYSPKTHLLALSLAPVLTDNRSFCIAHSISRLLASGPSLLGVGGGNGFFVSALKPARSEFH